jgi:hypothetical protein
VSLGIAIKGSEGVVLAADSRVTLFNQVQNPLTPGQALVIPASFDNATKVLRVSGQDFVGAVTYGLGAFNTANGPRTMHSFIPELEEQLKAEGVGRLSVSEFANRLRDFFVGQWNTHINRVPNPGEEINFLVGGFDDGAAYGRVFLFQVPTQAIPVEQNPGAGQFGITWGGQHDLVYRMLYGFDIGVPAFIQSALSIPPPQFASFKQQLDQKFQPGIPYQFLPIQDCIDLAVFLIQSTIKFQRFRTSAVRGVGGPIEVATITRSEGFVFRSRRQLTAVAN